MLDQKMGGREAGGSFGQGDTCPQARYCLPWTEEVGDCKLTFEFDEGVKPEDRVEGSDTIQIGDAWSWLQLFCTNWS